MSDKSARETYRCHGVENGTAALLLCDPVLNRALRKVLDE